MDYFSYHVRSPNDAYRYTQRVVALLRRRTDAGVLIHLIGGLANRVTPPVVAAFALAASACQIAGVSLYAFPEITPAEWAALDGHAGKATTAPCR